MQKVQWSYTEIHFRVNQCQDYYLKYTQIFHASMTSQRGMKFRSLGFTKVTSAKGSDCSICAAEAQGMQMTGKVMCVETHHWFRCDSALLA